MQLNSLSLAINLGKTVNSGGPINGVDPTSSTTITAQVDEILGGGLLLPTGYSAAIGGGIAGNGIWDFSGDSAVLSDSYILRPDTHYALLLDISSMMSFSDTRYYPSMGVTQEFDFSQSDISANIQFTGAPEPGAYVTMGAGLLGFTCFRRRRK